MSNPGCDPIREVVDLAEKLTTGHLAHSRVPFVCEAHVSAFVGKAHRVQSAVSSCLSRGPRSGHSRCRPPRLPPESQGRDFVGQTSSGAGGLNSAPCAWEGLAGG